MTDKAFKEKNPNFLREVKEQETKGSITHIAGAGGVGGGVTYLLCATCRQVSMKE